MAGGVEHVRSSTQLIPIVTLYGLCLQDTKKCEAHYVMIYILYGAV